MRMTVLAVVVALAACAGEDDRTSAFPDASGLYAVQSGAVSCPGAYREDSTDRVDCEWTCLELDGRDTRWLRLTFLRDDAASPWRSPLASFDFNGFEASCL